MPSASRERGLGSCVGHSFLLDQDGGGRFESHAEHDVLSVANAALDAAAAIRARADLPGVRVKFIVVLQACS